MALATKCPHCNTIFRVAADQLKLRGGIVRCGACQEVFDGNAALVEPAAKPTPVIPDVPVEAAHPAAAPAQPATAAYVHGGPVDFELDLNAEAQEPPAPAVWRTAGAPAPEPEAGTAPSPDDIALAAVARAFAEVVTPAAEKKPLAWDEVPASEERDEQPHPDGRLEPSLDTAQEHLVAAALDDAHHLEDLPADDEPALAEAEPEVMAEPAPEVEAEPEPAPDVEAAPPAEVAWSDPEEDSARDETALHAVAAVNADVPDDGASLPDDEPPAPVAQRSADDERMRALAGVDQAGEDLDHSDLSFVKRVDRSQKYGKALKITMALGIPLLLAGLVLQAATTFRDTLAANYPQLKPALSAICQPLGCQVNLPTQLDALSIEHGELASMAENTFSFSTVLRNQSKTVQAWPHIELTLNDNADKPVLRRVFAPREYLPSAIEAAKGFGPRSEQSVKLYFELKEIKASGYHISIFYP
ncbi:MAG: hypothetical protein K0R43_2209 [Pseudoduganella sp.]|jgi:predicted Zn finger-like uncharacterized protein|nr:hypothetical protein [Pseudoduganella sp.]